MSASFLSSSQLKAAKLLAALAYALMAQNIMAAQPAANALPTGGKVVAGAANIAQSGSTMNINQSTQRAVINWSGFDVGAKASVNFNQPNSQAATLNYVNSASKSMINGAVNANGQVIFVNPNGVVFGKSAEVNVGGMVATTMNTSSKEFMEGKAIQTYEGENSNGKIVNKGNITGHSVDSYIALMAPHVKNTGVITATMGGNNTVALVAGQKVSLTFAGSQLVSVSVDASVVNALISNKLLINAGGGQVIIAANAAQDLMGGIIKNTGTISANGISTAGGKISLVANKVVQNGTVSANSETANAGQIVISGNQVQLGSTSQTTATGATAGGQILIGKTTQNTAQSQINAKDVSIAEGALVDASATLNGNGGTIDVWSNNSTTVAGTFKAKGGAMSGNGGIIDTSSAGVVTYGKGLVVDTTAPKGRTGTWLTDPLSIVIDSSAAALLSKALSTTNVTLDASASACAAIGSCSQSATPVISFLADVYSANTLTSLTMKAPGGTINVNSHITAGSVYAVAQTINVNGSVNTNGGANANIYLAAAIINLLGNITGNGNGNGSNHTNSNQLNSANATTANNRRKKSAEQSDLSTDVNTYASSGGNISIFATGDISVGASSYISANGQNGGAISIVSTAGKTSLNGIADALGQSGKGGNIFIVGKSQTDVIGALISSEGLSQGGVINLGQVNNLGNGTILAPPANAPPELSNFVNTAVTSAVDLNSSITSNNIAIDSHTGINAPKGIIVVFGEHILVNNATLAATHGDVTIGRPSYAQGQLSARVAISNSTIRANRVETSGEVIGTSTLTVLANDWLLDPSNVTINATGPTTGGSLTNALATSGTTATTILASDIQNAINAGTSVNIVATGTITQSTALTFNITAAGLTPTFTLNNTSGSKQAITLIAITDNSAGTGSGVSLQAISAGGAIAVNGAINLKGAITLDNTYGAASGSPSSAYITVSSLGTLATTSAGITVDGALTAKGSIALNGVTAGSALAGINYSVGINSTAGDVTLNGIAIGANGFGVYNVSASTITANNITINGTTSLAPNWATYIGTLTINTAAVGGNITVTGNVLNAPGTAGGIYQSGIITARSGSNISFTSNNDINQIGAIYLTANTSGTAANITFDTTTGNKDSSIAIGNLTIAAGSSGSAINFIGKSAGSNINPGTLGSSSAVLPGTFTLDNTFGAASGLKASGYITASNASTLATASIGVTLDDAIFASGHIVVNGVTGGSSIAGISYSVGITSTASNVTFNGSATNGLGVYNLSASTITANNITIDGTTSLAPNWATYLGSLTINSGSAGGNIAVTGNVINTPGGAGGIYQSGTITTRNGSNISFTSNNDINQIGPIALAANTSAGAANVTYDTRTGNKSSSIVGGALTIASSTSSSAINYTMLSAGSAINPGALGTSAIALPGTVTLDNTYGAASGTKASGYITASVANRLVDLATNSVGVTVNSAIFASGNIAIIGASNSSYGIDTSANITSRSGNVTLNGATVATIGVYVVASNVVTANNITINGTSTSAPSWVTQIGYLTINSTSVGGNIAVTGNVIGTPGAAGGIYQTGTIYGANGSNISFTSNNDISQSGPVVLATNTSGSAANIVYDTSTGNKTSSIVSGTLTIASSASTSAINYTVKSAGAALNPGLIGTSAIVLPGAITIDNTFGGTAGVGSTPTSGFISASAPNLVALATTSIGVTLNAAIFARDNITINGASNSNRGIDASVNITSTNGNVAMKGDTKATIGVYHVAGNVVTANNITINGASIDAPGWVTQIAGLTINSSAVGGSIVVTGNVIGTPGAAGGIYQIGTITGASGTNISFTSNNNISQNGAINLAANTSSNSSNVAYDATTGNKTSSIATGLLSVAAGSLSNINYSVLASGSAINVASAVTVPGAVTLDNTYGCSGSGCVPTTGYLNTALSNWNTFVTTGGHGVLVGGNISGTAITINGINAGGSTGGGGGVMLSAGLTATSGNINLTGVTTAGIGVGNLYAGAWGTTPIAANNGAVNITGTSTTTGWGVTLSHNNSISAKSITVTGSEVGGTYAVYLNTLTIVAGGTNLNVTGIAGSGSDTGIFQSGAITNNAAGSNISFITNGKINQSGAISLVANTTSTAVSVTYNTTSGTKDSSVVSGAITVAAGTNTSPINYIIKTAGGAINPGAIGTSTLVLPGYVLLDNTYGCTASSPACTPITGFINTTTANLTTLATAAAGVTINAAIYTSGNITANAASTSNAIDYSVAIVSKNGDVALNGGVTTQRGVYNSVASTITANNIKILGTSSASPVWIVQLGAMTINSTAIGGSISVTGNYIGTPGALGGIYQTGAIAGASGSNISFISNNNISQSGVISLAANTSGVAANITYDVTTGNKTSTMLTGALSIPAGSTSAINYIIKTAGSAINPAAIGSSSVALPGYVLIDNTYGCAVSTPACTPVSGFINTTTSNLTTLATASVGATLNNVVYATGNITVNAVSTSNAIDYSQIIFSTGGSVSFNGGTTIQRGIYNSVASTITANNISLVGTSTSTPVWVTLIGALTINSGSIGGNISVTGNVIGAPGNAGGINQTGAITGASGSNISFISNNNVSQSGAINLAANTSGAAANITYDLTTGNKTSSILGGALSIPAGSTSAINYIVKTAGSAINPSAIGTGSLVLPGYVLIDNTYGCTASTPACTPVSGFINTTTANLANLATGSIGVTINNAIYARDNITVNGVTGGGANTGIDYSVALTSTAGHVILNGGATGGYAVYNSVVSTITANNITISGTTTLSPVWALQIGSLTVNTGSIGGNISLTANVIGIPGAAGGIYQSGAITLRSGSNISFISNNDIDQYGLISLVANTSGAVANISFDTTSGDKTSKVSAANVTIAAGTSTSAINYLVKTNGATISVPAITVPGYILLDNTCLGCATRATQSTAAVNGAAITITGALSAGTLAGTSGVTINAVANGSGVGFTQGANAIVASAGGVTMTVNGQAGIGYSSTGNITATGQAITISTTTSTERGIENSGAINGGVVTLSSTQSTSTATLTPIYVAGLITANSLTITASGGAANTIVSLGAITINAGGGNISVTANNAAAGASNGISQTGAITNYAIGSSISFISNHKISQTGAISLVANTGTSAANITYDTTAGINTSSITSAVPTITGSSTAAINYIVKTNGAIISVPAVNVSGYILLDNTCLGCATRKTTSTAATNGEAISITGALSAGTLAGSTGITINSVANGSGIGFNQGALAISSLAGGVSITAKSQTGTAYYSTGNITATGQAIAIDTTTTTAAGINDTGTLNGGVITLTSTQSTSSATATPITASGTITANSLTVAATGGASTTVVSLGAITLNAGGSSISVTASNAAAGANTGITQTGTITNNAVGSNISFVSNHKINQTGAITLVANTGIAPANIVYDTTTGTNASSITTGTLTVPSGATSAINYLVKSNGAIISVPAISVPGYIVLDNTCLGCSTRATATTAFLNGAGVTMTGALSAGALAGTTGVSINAVANGSGVGFTQGALAMSALAGGVTITANSQTGIAYSSTGNITATGQAITISTTTTTAAGISDTGTINGGAVTLTSTQSTSTATTTPITATGLITANSLTVSGSGGASTTIVSLGAITLNAGGGNISVAANNAAAGSNTGITQTGAITDNAVGSNISFISNNLINQTGAIALVANTGAPAANVIYDTTAGNKNSNITAGALTFTTGANSVINYIARSAGSAIATGAIGTSSAALPGYFTLDNTYGCTTAPCTQATGFITTSNASTLATASAGVTIASAIYTAGDVTIKGVSSSGAGVTYANAINSSARGISISGTSVGAASTSYGIYGSAAAGVVSAANTANGYVSYVGVSTLAGGASDAIRTVAGATITGGAGVNLFADGFSGNIATGALIRNSGTASGVTVNAYGNVSVAGITNSGVDGMRIIAGRGIAAGTTSGGNVTAVGTLTNTGGVIGVSMAMPGATTGDAIATALGITSANADATKNISYGVTGGSPEKAVGYSSTYTSGNFISYRQKVAGTVSIAVSLNNNYSAVYGTAYDSDAANAWIQANSTVSYTGAYTATFGIASTTLAYAKSVLIFSPTVGGSTAANGTNANAVQSGTTITPTSLSASDGSTVVLSGTARTYTITPAVLGISVSGVYNGTSTFTNVNATITTTGLASWDRITSVTASSANANGASTYVTAFAGNTPATSNNTFSASNYVIGAGYNGTLSSGVPVNGSQVTATNRVSITPAPLGVTVNAVYSGTTAVAPSSFTVTGLVNSQTMTAISSATINNANVSANASNYVTAITVSAGTASMSNYSITSAYNSLAGNTQNTVTLTPKSLTVSGVAIAAKTYDGTTTAVVSGGALVGVVTADVANVTLVQTASFMSAGAANNVALVMMGSISGTASSNYTLTVPTGITANIARKAITVGGTSVAAHKVYDGTTATTISGGSLVGVITVDLPNVSLSQSGSFLQSGVGAGLGVVVSTSISGTAASNYVVTQPSNLSANITAKALTVTGTAVTDKVYNGSTLASITGGTLVGVVGSETVSLTQAGTFASANVGTAIAVSITNGIGGAASANYTLVQPTGITGKITPAPLGISVAAIYSGSTTIAPSTFTVTGLVNGETITGISSALINNMNVAGNSTNFVRSVVISGGTANASNYAFGSVASSTPGTGLNKVTLTAKTLTVSGTLADSKVYDGTTAVKVWGGSLVGVMGVDVVTLKQAGALNSPNVGSAIPVVMSNTISGFSAPNYVLVQPSGVTGVVTPKVITISDGTVAHKVYDGTTNAVITGGSLVGVLSSDASNVTLTQAGRFSSPNVSNGIIIITSASISGTAAGNYALTQPVGITANITPAMLGISVVGVANGTNTISPISYTINGLINGQTITGLSSVSIKSSSISSNGSNFVTGIVISGGTALATNYAFAPSYNATAGGSQNMVTLVAQNQKILTVTGAAAASKVYDGTTAITVSGGTLVGVTSGDTINLVQSGVLINSNVSVTAAVALNFSITGTNVANYILVQPSGITTIVTPAPLGIVVTGEYNGTTSITPASFTATGLVNSETITGLSNATFNAINVSNNGSNFVTSITSSGGTASLSNYRITPTYSATNGTSKNVATLTAKALTVGGAPVAASKVYDGSTVATVTGGSLVGVIGTDNVTLNQAGSFAQAAVADGIAVTSSASLSGLSAGNYSLIQPTGIVGNITPKSLTISGVTVANKVYDGGTSATVTGGTLVGLVGSDGANVSLTQSGQFGSANAANAISVAVTASVSGSASGNYALVQPNPVSANITPKALTVSGTVVSNKVYDRTTDATVTAGSLVGVISADSSNVVFTRAGVFTSSSVGTAVAITMNSSISGSAATNYTLTQPTGVSANITAKPLTITASNVSSTYGSTTSLGTSAFTQTGLITGDAINTVTLQYSGSSAVAATVNAATYNSAIVASAASGSGLSNYAISYVAGQLTVTPATLTLAPIARSAVYNGNALNAATYSASAANYAVTGYKNADSASNVTLTLTGSLGFTANGASATVQNAGTYGYAAGNLAVSTSNTNYQVVLASSLTNSYVVTPATVALSASKVFDGTTTFTAGDAGTNFTVATGIGSQTLTVNGSASANSANVIGVSNLNTTGLSLVNGTGGGLASNYILPATTSNVAISPKSITASIANQTKMYDTSTGAILTAGNSSSDGSYILTGFMGNDGAYISQTVGSYNSANVASATTVTAVVGSSYVAKGGSILTNYVLPTTVSTAAGGASISPAPLTMTANDVSTFVGVAPATPLAYQLTGLLGADTATTAISSATVTYSADLLNASMSTPTLNALTPSATSSNYSLTFVKGSLMVADNYQMIVNAGSNTATYGAVNSTNVSYLGNALSASSGITAGYCTNCAVGVTSPTIINLTIAAPSAGSNVWTATDALGFGVNTGQGKYTFEIAPVIPSSSYGAGNNLNVGNIVLNASNLQLVPNYSRNYSATKPIIYNTGTLSVTPKALTVINSVVDHKIYDATNVATITGGQLVGIAANDSAYLNLAQSGSFASVNVANGIAVSASNSLSGSVASNYVLTQSTGLTANITPAPVTISGLSAANKVYNANQVAILSGTPTISGLLGSDTASIASGSVTGQFASANVGTGIAVAANTSGLTISNTNYRVTGVSTLLAADITPAQITVTAAKTYDGSNSVAANQMTIAGVASQTLTLTSAGTGTLSNPNVGTASLTTLNNAELVNGTDGSLASNYTVVDPIFSAVTISPAAITVGVNNLTKVYDKTLSTASAVTAPALQLKSGTLFMNEGTSAQDTLSGGAFAYTDVNAGTSKTVNVSNASVVSGSSTVTQNYTITYEANTASEITRAPIMIAGLSAANKVYDTGRVAVLTGTPVIDSGLFTNDSSSLSGTATAGTFAGPNVGSGIAVAPTLSNLSLSNTNYFVAGTSIALAADITAAPLTISGLSAANKIYDTTTTATLSGTPTVQGVLSGDSATVSGAVTGSFASANKGNGLSVTADLSQLLLSNTNYYLSGVTTALTADIAAAPIIIGGLSAADKVYNRSDVAALTGTPVIASGLLGSDSAALSGTATAGTFASLNVGNGIAVTPTLTNLSLANTNYYIAGIDTTLTASISPAPVTVSGLSVANKVYDATNVATVSGTPTAYGVLSGDSVTVSGAVSAGFVSANVGSGIAVTANLAGLTLSNTNYQITGMTASLAADISAAPLTVTADNKSMVYGSTTPALTYAYSGLVGGDTSASFNGAIATNATSTSSVGSAYTITRGTLASSGNYQIATFNQASLTIAARPVTVTVGAGQSKVYGDADPSAYSVTIQTQGTDVGLLTGATLGGTLVRAAGENVGAYAISSGSMLASNPNYAITFVDANFAITPRPITITANSGQSKVYGNADGLLTYAISSGSLATFGSVSDSLSGTLIRDAGNQVGSIYAINQGGLTNTANPNYNITYVGATFQVTPRPITLTAPSINKVYDGSYSYDHTAAELAIMNQQLVGSDTFNAVKAVFDGNNPNVGTGKVITIDASSLVINDGNSGRNYTVNTTNATGNITPASLLVTAANDAKFSVEAETGAYAGALYKGFIGGETVANLPLASRTLQITRSDASNNTPGTYTLTPGGHGAQGATVGNYQVSYVNGLYTILGPQDLLIRASAVTSYASTPTYQFTAKYLAANGSTISYIGTNGASLNPIDLSSSGSAAFTLNDGAGGQLTTAFMPLATSLSASGQVNAGQYNVTSTANPSKTGFANLTVVGSLLVEPMAVTTPNLSASSLTKIYDGSAALSSQVNNLLRVSAPLVAGDAATLSAVGTYDDKTVGTSKSVAMKFSISGADAANYALGSTTVTATGNITPAPLTFSAGLAANNKIYDSTTDATIGVTGIQNLAGVIGNDAVSVSSTGTYTGATFSQSNVGAGLIVTPATSIVNGLSTMTGVTLTGAEANNYYVTGLGSQTLSANITPKPITISAGLTASNKVYDATTLASIAVTGTPTLSGVISTDVANVSVSSSGSHSGAFVQTNVGTGITVSPTTIGTVIAGGTYNAMTGLTLGGSAAGNYYVSGVSSTLAADITPYIISAGATTGPRVVAAANNKIYSATNTASGTLAMVGLLGSDSVSIGYSGATFASPNVANGIDVTFAGVTLSGTSAANYDMTGAIFTAPANITPAPVTINGLAATSKQYDGSTAAVIGGVPAINGLIGSDTSTLTGQVLSGAFASANVGTGIGVTANLSSLTLGNSNYYIAGVTLPLLGDITSPPQTVTLPAAVEITSPPQTISNIAAVVQQVNRMPALTVTSQSEKISDNKGETLYVRDPENINGFFEAISVPQSGTVSFPLPNQFLQNLLDTTGLNTEANAQLYKYLLLTDGATISVSAEDGKDLPKGVTYSPASRAFTVSNLAEVTLPISVMVTVTRQGNVVSTKKLLVTR